MDSPGHDTTSDEIRCDRAAARSLRWAALAGALAVLGLFAATAISADAQSIGDLEARISAAQSEAASLGADIEAKTAQLDAARAEAAAAAAREAQLSALLAEGQQRQAELETRVQQTQARLQEARARLQRALDALAQRLIAIYKDEAPDATQLLLQADGFDDLATRAELLDRIQQADQQLAARVRELRADVATRLDAVERARDEQAAYNARVAGARDQIAAVRASAEAQAAALEQARAQQAAAVESLRSQVGQWTSQVEQLQAAQQQAATATAQEEVASWVGSYAVPEAIVMCESGGDYGAVNGSSGAGGAYQILPSTWRLYGGSGLPHQASPAQQDRIAAQIWADSGASAWECAQ